MARMNDASPHPQRWTNAKLLRELNRVASMENAHFSLPEGYTALSRAGLGNSTDTAVIREATRLYRQTWLQPIIDELARRAKVTLTNI